MTLMLTLFNYIKLHLAVAMDMAKSLAFEVFVELQPHWRCAKEVCKGVMNKAKWFVVRKPVRVR